MSSHCTIKVDDREKEKNKEINKRNKQTNKQKKKIINVTRKMW